MTLFKLLFRYWRRSRIRTKPSCGWNLRAAVQRGAMTSTHRGTTFLIVSREVRPPIRTLCPCCHRYKTRPQYFILLFVVAAIVMYFLFFSMKYFSSFQEDFCLILDFSKIWTSASRIIPNGISDHNKSDFVSGRCVYVWELFFNKKTSRELVLRKITLNKKENDENTYNFNKK